MRYDCKSEKLPGEEKRAIWLWYVSNIRERKMDGGNDMKGTQMLAINKKCWDTVAPYYLSS